jgi:hypothetical protein
MVGMVVTQRGGIKFDLRIAAFFVVVFLVFSDRCQTAMLLFLSLLSGSKVAEGGEYSLNAHSFSID